MKIQVKNLLLLSTFIAGLLMPTVRLTAQIFTTLHNFAGEPFEGITPASGVILSDNKLYGTTTGSVFDGDVIFAMNPDGTGYTNLHSFSTPAYDDTTGAYTNSDGYASYAELVSDGHTLFGTTAGGGNSGSGTVFSLDLSGTNFTVLHHFPPVIANTNSDGATPFSGVIISGNTLFGAAASGGILGSGTVYSIKTNGADFTVLHAFTTLFPNPSVYTNSDGAYLLTGLILSSNALYGTARIGGNWGNGTIYKVNTNGTGLTTVYHFPPFDGPDPSTTNSQGASPSGKLAWSNDTLFGTASSGGTEGSGTLFAVNTDGTGFRTLHNFSVLPSYPGPYTNSDGFNPTGGLILSSNTLYGTTQGGGNMEYGTLFSINIEGTEFANLFNFGSLSPITNNIGTTPSGGLFFSGNSLYGTAAYGGSASYGTVFRFTVGSENTSPQLAVARFGTNLVLTWPITSAGFTLQSTTNLFPPSTWTTVTPAPVIESGSYAVTNGISGTQKFYRLSQ